MSSINNRQTHLLRLKSISADFILYLFLFLFAMAVVSPYLWMLFSSFKPSSEIFTVASRLLPHRWTIENYVKVLAQNSFMHSIFNSVVITIAGVLLEVSIAFLGAYAFARLDFWGKDFLFALILGTMMVPPQVLMLPSYLLINNIGWQDTYAGLIIPRAGAAFGIFLLRQFIRTIPDEMDDAAQIDGASTIVRMLAIYLPLCLPSIVTVGIFSMLGYWNDYYWPLVITSDRRMQTVALSIAQFKNLEGMGNWELIMAAAILASLPMLLVYLFARKLLLQNLTAGAVHGK